MPPPSDAELPHSTKKRCWFYSYDAAPRATRFSISLRITALRYKQVAAAKRFPNNTIQYHPAGALGIGGPNSNSAAHYFGVVSGFNPNPPTTAYGRWSPIVLR